MDHTCEFCGAVFHKPPSRGLVRWCDLQCKKGATRRLHNAPLVLDRLKEVVDYDQVTGWFTWRISGDADWRRARNGRAGSVSRKGYRWVLIDGKPFQAHRLAWFYMTGEWPNGQIDHRDLQRDNNAWDNLRLADNSKNQRNIRARRCSKTGLKGASPKGNRFVAQIQDGRGVRYLGMFNTAEEAHAAYAKAAAELHGEFARTA